MEDSTFSDFIPLRHSNTYQRNLNHEKLNLTCELDADEVRSRHGIEVDGNNVPAPIKCFEDMGLPTRYLSFLKMSKKVENPTPIQMQAIGCLVKQRDIIGLSATGSGKTYAYILPMLLLLDKHLETVASNEVSPICLILVPSRELMSQVYKNINELLEVSKKGLQRLNVTTYNENNSDSSNYVNHCNYAASPGYYMGVDPLTASSNSMFLQQPNLQTNKLQQFNEENNYIVGICGGVPIAKDLTKLNSLTKIIVSTPGRLIDLYDRNKLSLSKIKYFVIDECDKLLDMGLEEQLRKIIAMVSVYGRSLQTSLWSATLPESLERIARTAVVDPIYIHTGIKCTVGTNIKQNVIFMHSYMKQKTLLNVLRQIPYPPIIIFAQSKHKTDELTEVLQNEQFHAASIHSDKEQTYRNEVMSAFEEGELDILVSTDLISRGIDLPAVTHVINFDTPDSIEDYLHRCGRTGRFGREGVATTFLTLDCKIANELKEMLQSTNNNIPAELFDTSIFGKKVLKTEMGDRVIY